MLLALAQALAQLSGLPDGVASSVLEGEPWLLEPGALDVALVLLADALPSEPDARQLLWHHARVGGSVLLQDCKQRVLEAVAAAGQAAAVAQQLGHPCATCSAQQQLVPKPAIQPPSLCWCHHAVYKVAVSTGCACSSHHSPAAALVNAGSWGRVGS